MDAAEFFWGWLNGLVRRAAIGALFYFFFAIICLLLVIAAYERDQGLEKLDGYSRAHSRLTEAFLDIAEHATEVAGSSSRAKAISAVQPLRQSLSTARDVKAPKLDCGDVWLEGLHQFQTVPGKIANACPTRSGTECSVPHHKLLLEDLIAFERGLASVEDMLKAFDQLCHSKNGKSEFCGYFLENRDDEVAALQGLVSSHYREKPPRRASFARLFGEDRRCTANQTFLTSAAALQADIDSTARPRTLADFERLGDTITAMRVAMQTEDTRVSSAPAGGFLTVLLPKDVSFPILHFLALIAVLYAFLQVRRLRHLASAHTLDKERLLYALYPVASHVFTAPVFGVRLAERSASKRMSRASVRMTSAMFDWIPTVALGFSGLAVLSAITLRVYGSNEFSPFSLAAALTFFGGQLIVTLAYRTEQRAVQAEFDAWVGEQDQPEVEQGETA